MFLLDTDTCIHYLNGSDAGLTRRVLAAGPEQLTVSALTAGELHFGAARSSRPDANRERLATFLRELTVVPFDAQCGSHFGRIKAELFGRGRPIPDFDVGIAATAAATGRTLVSGDRHMGEIPGLPLQNWLTGGQE
jgi:tRNA(fMet)-specific endonuclease VapC